MIYNEFQDIRLSALGMGNMRLPVIDGDDSRIDIKASEEIIDYCMSKGINYYDTAWGYHSGNSELVVGDLRRTASQVQDAQISCCSLIMSLN